MVEVIKLAVTGAVPDTGVGPGAVVLAPGEGSVVVDPSTTTVPLDARDTVSVLSVYSTLR